MPSNVMDRATAQTYNRTTRSPMDSVVPIADKPGHRSRAADKLAKRRESAAKMSVLVANVSAGVVAMDGMVFRDIRDALGVSLRDLEEASGVSRSFIADWETGSDGNPGLEQSVHQALRKIVREKVQADLVALAVLEKLA